MNDSSINRKEFLAKMGKCCVGSCLCAVMLGARRLGAQDSADVATPEVEKPRSQERIEFAEKWAIRFFDVLDSTLDEETRRKIMMANGKACFLAWIEETGQEIKPVTLESLTERVNKNVQDGSIRIEGNVIYLQYMTAAETGLASEEGACLCPFIETKPAGLSGTYCLCSVGYIKQWHEMLLGRPAEVELLESTLMGGERCKFKITVV